MIRQLALTPGNDVPRLEHPLKLVPQEKIRLVLNTHQNVYRIKNCCGELDGLLALNNLCFNIRNRDWDKDFYAEAGTTLTEILNHPQIITFVRVLTAPTQKPRRCFFVEKGSVNDGRTDSAAAAAVQSPASADDDNNKADSTTKDDDTAASPSDESRKKADEEEEEEDGGEDETDFLPCCICGKESASLWALVDNNKADDKPSDTTKE
jgi:hypothetical protein